MREEATKWWKQALEDLDTAKYNASGNKYYAAAFFCHQAVEKALKALYLAREKELPGRTHSLIALARKLEVPQRYHRFLKELTAEYVVSRYPNATDEIPAALYGPEILEDYIRRSEEVLRWVEEELRKIG